MFTSDQATWDWSFQTPFKMGLGYGRMNYAQLLRESPVFEVKNGQETDEPMQVIALNYPGDAAPDRLELHIDAHGRITRTQYNQFMPDGTPSLREETIFSGFENHPVGGVDVWLPREMVCRHSKWSAPDKRFLLWMTELVHVKAVAVDQAIAPETFRLAFPADCKVYDATRDVMDHRTQLDTAAANARMEELRAGKK